MKHRMAQVEFLLGAGLLLMITLLVFIAAVMRFFDYPLIWSVDMAQLLFIWLCFIGAARALRQRAHLGMDFLVSRFHYQQRFWLELMLGAVTLLFLLLLAYEGYQLSLLNQARLFGDSGLPYFYVTIAVPIGCVWLATSLVLNAREAWCHRGKESDKQILLFSRAPSDSEKSHVAD